MTTKAKAKEHHYFLYEQTFHPIPVSQNPKICQLLYDFTATVLMAEVWQLLIL